MTVQKPTPAMLFQPSVDTWHQKDCRHFLTEREHFNLLDLSLLSSFEALTKLKVKDENIFHDINIKSTWSCVQWQHKLRELQRLGRSQGLRRNIGK